MESNAVKRKPSAIGEAFHKRQFVGRLLTRHLEPVCRINERALEISRKLAEGRPVTERDMKYLGWLLKEARVPEDIRQHLEGLPNATASQRIRAGAKLAETDS